MDGRALSEQDIVKLLASRGEMLATAESCTGGLIAHRITQIPGSSAVFLGGVVAYSNALKVALLGVRQETLLTFGAVSGETAREMAAGARERLGAQWSVAVTGIAGPTGGTPEKPTGLVYVAVAGPGKIEERRHQFSGNRVQIKEQSADAALQFFWESINE